MTFLALGYSEVDSIMTLPVEHSNIDLHLRFSSALLRLSVR